MQLIAGMLALAQRQKMRKPQQVYIVYGVTIVNNRFEFFQAHFSHDYLTELENGYIPVNKLLLIRLFVEQNRTFTITIESHRAIIHKLFNLILKVLNIKYLSLITACPS